MWIRVSVLQQCSKGSVGGSWMCKKYSIGKVLNYCYLGIDLNKRVHKTPT